MGVETRGKQRKRADKQNRCRNFDEMLLEAIDEALSNLGENVKAKFYFHVEDLFGIRRTEIPSRLGDFSAAIEKIFGPGARHLEIMFMKNLHTKTHTFYEWSALKYPLSRWIVPEIMFPEHVQLMRLNFERKSKNKMEIGVLPVEEEELQF